MFVPMNFYTFLAIFLAVDLLLVVYVLYRRSKKKFAENDLRFFKDQWAKIQGNSDAKHAILDADKLLNVVLGKKGFHGGVGDQLKKAEKIFTDVNGVWSSHKLRNRIAHELDMRVSMGERTSALKSFEKALKDLGALS